MNVKFFIKFFTLFLAFMMTIYCIFLLNQGHLGDFFGSLGMGKYSQTFNWCSNRVSKIEAADNSWVLEEKEGKWLVTKAGGSPLFLNYLDVEKWLAQYCQLHIQVYRSESLLDKPLTPYAKAYFNDGEVASIFILDQDTYQINHTAFKSPEMQEALAELKRLLTL